MSWTPAGGEPEPRRVGESLERVARSLSIPGTKVLGAVFGRWAEAVGPTVAAHARPVNLAGDVLVVAVDEPAWATQLRFLEGDVLRRLAEAAGAPVAARLEVRVRSEKPARRPGSATGRRARGGGATGGTGGAAGADRRSQSR